jgi:DNA-binding NtrC family response regulator
MSEKVLLVDDEQEFVETLAERMKTRGMDVAISTSPSEALEKVENQSYDAIVVDLMMPEMDGLQMLSNLKEKNPDLQVILLTGYGSVQKGVEAMKLGAMDFLEKPIDIKVLSEKIKKAKAQKMILVEKRSEEKIKHIMETKGW